MVVSGDTVLDQYDELEEWYSRIEELADNYDSESLERSAEILNDILSDEPSTSVYELIPRASNVLSEAKKDVEKNDRVEISKMIQKLEEEIKSHPAQTKERHYDSRRDQNNL